MNEIKEKAVGSEDKLLCIRILILVLEKIFVGAHDSKIIHQKVKRIKIKLDLIIHKNFLLTIYTFYIERIVRDLP